MLLMYAAGLLYIFIDYKYVCRPDTVSEAIGLHQNILICVNVPQAQKKRCLVKEMSCFLHTMHVNTLTWDVHLYFCQYTGLRLHTVEWRDSKLPLQLTAVVLRL